MRSDQRRHVWRLCTAEFVGTALLVLGGLSVVIFAFSPSEPVVGWLGPGWRRALTGLLFGTTGALIAVSPLGRTSGAHINPIVTVSFVLRRRMRPWLGVAYVAAQLAGAVAGALLLLIWGHAGRQVDFGATTPGASYGAWAALGGEVVTSAALVVLLFTFLGSPRLRRWTPLLFPPLYSLMVFAEAPVSGTSTNPARSLGPAVAADVWHGWWVYWVGPVVGAVIGLAISRLPLLRELDVEIAKVYHFEHDPHELLRWVEEKASTPIK